MSLALEASKDNNQTKIQFLDKPLETGRQDHIAGYRDVWRILENYPRASFAVLDRSGHNLHIEQPQLFNALISEWLDRVRETM